MTLYSRKNRSKFLGRFGVRIEIYLVATLGLKEAGLIGRFPLTDDIESEIVRHHDHRAGDGGYFLGRPL